MITTMTVVVIIIWGGSSVCEVIGMLEQMARTLSEEMSVNLNERKENDDDSNYCVRVCCFFFIFFFFLLVVKSFGWLFCSA